jgi:hypothetical protein
MDKGDPRLTCCFGDNEISICHETKWAILGGYPVGLNIEDWAQKPRLTLGCFHNGLAQLHS